MTKKIDITKHVLVPKHTKITDAEKKKIIERYNISGRELPSINKKDPAIQHLDAKEGNVIKIIRDSHTTGKATFYRRVINA